LLLPKLSGMQKLIWVSLEAFSWHDAVVSQRHHFIIDRSIWPQYLRVSKIILLLEENSEWWHNNDLKFSPGREENSPSSHLTNRTTVTDFEVCLR
jgi:hypothetical protein